MPRKRLNRALLAVLISSWLLTACDLFPGRQPQNTPTPSTTTTSGGDARQQLDAPVSLVLSPESFEFTPGQTERQLFLSTSPEGKLDWQVSDLPAWLKANPDHGTIDRNIVKITLTLNNTELPDPKGATSKIEIITNSGKASVPVSARLGTTTARGGTFPTARTQAPPVEPTATTQEAPSPLTFSVTSLEIGENDDSALFKIGNSNPGPRAYSITSENPALSVSPSSGYVPAGQEVEIKVLVNRKGLPAGKTPAQVVITTDDGSTSLALPVTISVAARPNAEASVSRLRFFKAGDSKKFALKNTGSAPLNWSLQSSEAWLKADPASGKLEPGAAAEITANAGSSAKASATGTLTVKSDSAGGEIVVPAVVAGAKLGSDLWPLDHRVTDAEYNANADILVTISDNPPQLNIIDPELQKVEHVALPLPGSTVSVSPDGAFAAVGHNAQISYVDLKTRAVKRTYAVTCDVLDVILPNANYVYAFPRTDQWTRIFTIDLENGLEMLNEGGNIYAGTVGRLHPSGDFIYGANNGLSPSDFEKYDIRAGNSVMLYDSPYHGDYAFAGNVWISEDGTRLFAKSGNVFRSSGVQKDDMLYAGNLAGATGLRWVATSTAGKRIFALDGGSYQNPISPGLRVYDDAFLNYKGTVDMPKWKEPNGQTSNVEGHYVFVDSSATRVYVLVNADPNSGIALDWAVAAFDMSKMP